MTVRSLLTVCSLTLGLGFVGCKGAKPDGPLTGTESLHDLMESMESASKPLFDRSAGAALTDVDVTALTASASRVQAINAAVKTRFAGSKPPTFAAHAEQLEKGTQEVLAALTAKDAAALQAATKSLGGACGSCHKEFK
ncbi:MAG: cytochrome c [Myxococcales bacterium]|nr:cytochrome c [Myxococcales bacterium]